MQDRNSVTLCDAETLDQLHDLRHADELVDVCFGSGGNSVATVTKATGEDPFQMLHTVHIWDIAQGQRLRQLSLPERTERIDSIHISNDIGHVFIIWTERSYDHQIASRAALWNVETGREIRKWTSKPILGLFVPGSHELLVEWAEQDARERRSICKIALFDRRDGNLIRTYSND
jgi:WD40 repeat protein